MNEVIRFIISYKKKTPTKSWRPDLKRKRDVLFLKTKVIKILPFSGYVYTVHLIFVKIIFFIKDSRRWFFQVE